MASRYWVGADSSWNTSGNWSATSGGGGGAGVPGATDDVIFDGSDVTACTCDVAINIGSLDVQGSGGPNGAYSGKLDFADSAYAHACAGDMTFDGSGEVDQGDSTITCSGNFDNKDQTTWTKGTSTLVMDGTSKSITVGADFYGLVISGTITIHSASKSRAATTLIVDLTKSLTIDAAFRSLTGTNNGTITVNASKVFTASTIFTNNGVLTGTGQIFGSSATLVNNSGKTWDITTTQLNSTSTLVGGTYGGTWTCFADHSSGTRTLTMGNAGGQTITWTGSVTFSNTAAGTYAIDCAANNPDIVFQGSVTLQEPAGTLSYSKGSGTITFSGANDVNADFNGEAVEDIVVADKSGGKVTLTGTVTTDSFVAGNTGTCELDFNGQSITTVGDFTLGSGASIVVDADAMNGATVVVGGNFSADGQTLNATATWSLQVTGTAVASGTGAVAYSDASGFTEIDASAGPWTDNGNNTNWNFGVVAQTMPIVSDAGIHSAIFHGLVISG